MQAQDIIVVAFLAFLLTAISLLAGSVRRGRALCDELAMKFPSEYEDLGSPRPGFFNGSRRSAYMTLVMQSRFERIDDPILVEQFVALRRSKLRQLVFMLAGFGVLGAAALWYELLRAA